MRNTTTAAALISGIACVVGCEEKAPPAAAPKPAGPMQPAAPAPQQLPSAPSVQALPPGPVSALGLNFTLPANWKAVVPANPMRIAEVQVPDASGDAAKVCTVVFSTAGGDVDQNIARWGNQVTDAAGQPTKPNPTVREVGGMKVHTVELTGAFANMGETSPHQNWMLRGAVVETPEGLLFVKMFGPVEQMTAAGTGFTAMIDGMKK